MTQHVGVAQKPQQGPQLTIALHHVFCRRSLRRRALVIGPRVNCDWNKVALDGLPIGDGTDALEANTELCCSPRVIAETSISVSTTQFTSSQGPGHDHSTPVTVGGVCERSRQVLQVRVTVKTQRTSALQHIPNILYCFLEDNPTSEILLPCPLCPMTNASHMLIIVNVQVSSWAMFIVQKDKHYTITPSIEAFSNRSTSSTKMH